MRVVLFGDTGYAHEVRDICAALHAEVIAYIGQGEENNLPEGCCYAIAIGNNRIRQCVAERFPYLNYVNLIHPWTSIAPGIIETKGVIVAAGVMVAGTARVGDFCILNFGSMVAHDCVLETFVNVSPGANILGGAVLKEGAYIGAGAQVLPNVTVGSYATVGAGAAVTNDVPDGVTAVGVPAKWTGERL